MHPLLLILDNPEVRIMTQDDMKDWRIVVLILLCTALFLSGLSIGIAVGVHS